MSVKGKRDRKVDAYVARATTWQEEIRKLREILLNCGLTEELKWGKPCYAVEGGNVVIIQPFKAYCALLFFKGFLLKDPNLILVKTGENTVVGRQVRFTDVREIAKIETVLKRYVRQAIAVEKSGVKIELKPAPLRIPEELTEKMNEFPALRKAFRALTPGRQRGYSFYFCAAKQSKTREARIEKCLPRILAGKGLQDR